MALSILHDRPVWDHRPPEARAGADDDGRLGDVPREAVERRERVEPDARCRARVQLVRQKGHFGVLRRRLGRDDVRDLPHRGGRIDVQQGIAVFGLESLLQARRDIVADLLGRRHDYAGPWIKFQLGHSCPLL